VSAAALPAMRRIARAQNYPSRAAGWPTRLARIIADQLTVTLGQPGGKPGDQGTRIWMNAELGEVLLAHFDTPKDKYTTLGLS
jgi:hypothetical protein